MPDFSRIFSGLGLYVKLARQLEQIADATLTFTDGGANRFTSLDAFREQFGATLGDDLVERERLAAIDGRLTEFAATVHAMRDAALAEADRFIETVTKDEIDSPSAHAAAVAADLRRAMLQNGETVRANAVTLLAASGASPLAGTGFAALFAEADGGAEALAVDERARAQTLTLVCEGDQWRNGAAPGEERFRLFAEDGASTPVVVVPESAGDAPHAVNRVLDGSFETHDGDTFTHWTIASGAAIVQVGSASEAFLGTSCLKFQGNGATAAKVTQSLAALSPPLTPGGTVVAHARIRAAGVTAGRIEMSLEGSGYASARRVAVTSDFPTSWTAFVFHEMLPRQAVAGARLAIALSADVNGDVFVDHVALAAPAALPFAGVVAAIFRGDRDFVAGPTPDTFHVRASVADLGLFQTFFRDHHGLALPSATSPTVPDSLAE